MSDYLWNGAGPADPGIEALERRLQPLRFDPKRNPVRLERAVRSRAPYFAIAASIAVGAVALGLLTRPSSIPTEWAVTGIEGDVRVGRSSVSLQSKLKAGQPLTTGPGARASLANLDFGELNLAPDSVLRVIQSSGGRDVMSLDRGRLHAFIWAPPRQFVVDTPSSRAVDLGCEYTLTVDRRGDGMVEVELGWVAFQFGAQESFIPAGAACRTTRTRGPGIPFYRDSSAELRDALERYEADSGPEALAAVLAAARAPDGITLWHLLTRVPAAQRGAVFDRFAQIVSLPSDVRREKALARDAGTIDRCWNALGLDDAGWWREWKHEWKAESGR